MRIMGWGSCILCRFRDKRTSSRTKRGWSSKACLSSRNVWLKAGPYRLLRREKYRPRWRQTAWRRNKPRPHHLNVACAKHISSTRSSVLFDSRRRNHHPTTQMYCFAGMPLPLWGLLLALLWQPLPPLESGRAKWIGEIIRVEIIGGMSQNFCWRFLR